MKVLLMTYDMVPTSGWGRYSSDLTQALRGQGVEVGIIARTQEGHAGKEFVADFTFPPPTSYQRIGLLWWWYVVVLFVKHAQQLRSYDVIHCCMESYAPIAWGLSKILRIPFIITAHGSFAITTLRQPNLASLQSLAYRRAAYIVCVSAYTQNKLRKAEPRARSVVIHNGVRKIFESPHAMGAYDSIQQWITS